MLISTLSVLCTRAKLCNYVAVVLLLCLRDHHVSAPSLFLSQLLLWIQFNLWCSFHEGQEERGQWLHHIEVSQSSRKTLVNPALLVLSGGITSIERFYINALLPLFFLWNAHCENSVSMFDILLNCIITSRLKHWRLRHYPI